MNLIFYYSLLLKGFLCQMTKEQELIYQQWNILFKNELQLEVFTQQPEQPQSNPGGPPSNPDSEENKMIQKLSDQENAMESNKQNIIQQRADNKLKFEQDLENQKKLQERLAAEKAGVRPKGQFKDGEDQDEDAPSLQLKKPLQKFQNDGNKGEGLQPNQINLLSNQHKIIILSILIVALLFLIQIREFSSLLLDKYFRKALQIILLDSMMILMIHLLAIALYYYSFYDVWYLSGRELSDRKIVGIKMVQIKQSIEIPNNTIIEVYYIDVYGYLLISIVFFITLLFWNLYYICLFDSQQKQYKQAQVYWPRREELAEEYEKTSQELKNQKARYDTMTVNKKKKPPQAAKLLVEIESIKKNLSGQKFTMDYLCLKNSFLQNPQYLYPYMGPSSIRDDFDFADYLGRVTALQLTQISQLKPVILISLLAYLAVSGLMLLIFQKLFNPIIAISVTILISHSITFLFFVEINYSLSQAKNKVTLSSDDEVHLSAGVLKQTIKWYPEFLKETYEGKIPTPDKFLNGPRVPQQLLFIKQSPEYTQLLISFFLKMSLLTNFVLFAYLYYYFQSSFWIKLVIMGFSLIYTGIALIKLIPSILVQLILCNNIEMLRNYDIIYKVVKDQKVQLCLASQHFLEFLKYIRRLNSSPQKISLIIHRPFLLEVFLDALQEFQKGGKQLQNYKRSAMEQDMIDFGINEADLGLYLPAAYLPDICQKLGIMDIDKYEMLYLTNFCTIKPQKDNDGNIIIMKEDLISPSHLLLFIQLRIQEVLISKQSLIEEALSTLVTILHDPIEPDDIASKLAIQYHKKIQPSKVVEEDSPDEDDIAEQSQSEEHKSNTSDQLIEDVLEEQFKIKGYIDLDEFERFIQLYCEANLFDSQMLVTLMKHLRYMDADTKLTLQRFTEFIINQVDLKPS